MYINPYQNLSGGKWCKANFHAHAGTEYEPGSCGQYPMDLVAKIYRECGFDILCFSNHDLFIEPTDYSKRNLLMIPGVEYSGTDCCHMLTIGVRKSLHELDHQGAIDETVKTGGLAVICHPNWPLRDHWKVDDIEKLVGYTGLEVMNMCVYRMEGSGLAADIWDHLLSQGRLVYGFGSDDFHEHFDAGRSFNLIYCDGKDYGSMKAAIDRGAFCVSTGLWLEYLMLDGDSMHVKVRYPIETFADTFAYRFVSENGRVLSEQKGSCSQYRLTDENYLRVEAIGENGAMLFTQPVYREGALKKV
jgi:hypothetical protein